MKLPLSIANVGSKALTLLDAEVAHKATIASLKRNFIPAIPSLQTDRLSCSIAGVKFENPLGLAAGFDKNAEVPNQMLDLGFGFVEVGAVTPLPQDGNAKPRVFRLRNSRAVINRYGFNNEGLEKIKSRLLNRSKSGGPVGVNLGANKKSGDRTQDFVTGLSALEGHVDFCTVNISSPNTPGLRALQGKASLDDLLSRVMGARKTQIPVFLKIAPDLTDEDKADIAASSLEHKISGLIISNTTLERDSVSHEPHAKEVGGLSGEPLYPLSTTVLREFAMALKGQNLPLIGVGGVFSAKDAYRKILYGASLVQLYTALIYEGPGLPHRILEGLLEFLDADGFENISQAIGADLQ